MKKYLGVDWGKTRIGLALGDDEIKIATPYKTVANLAQVLLEIKNNEIDEIVIGEPVKLSGEKSFLPQYNDFVSHLKKEIKLPIVMQDERLSTLAGRALFGDKKNKAGKDELAAMLILQAYFDGLKNLPGHVLLLSTSLFFCIMCRIGTKCFFVI